MSKKLLMFCAAILALALVVPAYAEVQNVKVSGDLTINALDRYNFALGNTDVNCGGHQDVLYSVARLRVDAELTDNVSVVTRLLNERIWGEEYYTDNDGATQIPTGSAITSSISLDLAYAVLKEFLYSPLTLTLGRQELHFGNDLIIGDVDGNSIATPASPLTITQASLTDLGDLSVRKSFDALRGTLNYTVADQPLTVDMVYSVIDENLNNRDDDVRLYGGNANYPVNNDILTEAYFWTRERRPDSVASITGALTPGQNELKTERLHVIGTRGVYTGIDNLTLQGEWAYQFGNKYMDSTLLPNLITAATILNNPNGYRLEDSLEDVSAWALQLGANYAFEDVRHLPVLGIIYTHLSGENPYDCSGGISEPDGAAWNGWDAMFENQATGTIWNKLLGYSNCDLINVTGSVKPDFIDDLTIFANWYHIRLDQQLSNSEAGLYILSGVAGGQTFKVSSDKHVGDEIDVNLVYDYTEDVQLGLNLGWFTPGDLFKSTDGNEVNMKTATQAIASCKVTF
ncbi:MAG: hypothetical protein COV72_02665 [Candidatus Omnitrophica bacterium CG11_big_fil_rev_8_21_14_0_20_42_13]|uniref:Alginate export domain-containing protein n=1 Tax=Candidatus Ghiorseimicrobium undicola TaxID=1974746 RepID=A0A2H0M0U4_9BACT|nr:MAG: hypothetical protein COV72_02665 [Candidatus Omnitrophica bacterium CG11_big_fil_rev_8_21_14_0_20_42_13]